MAEPLPKYWIVGAARRGTDDHYEDFVGHGYWKLFWADEDPGSLTPAQARQVELRRQISQGDWIAIKKKKGGKHDEGKIVIRAIGLVKDVSRSQRKVLVKWLRADLHQEVAGTGWGSSLHGPFSLKDKHVREVFSQVHAQPSSYDTLAEDVKATITDTQIDVTPREALIDARVGQGRFRSSVLKLWDDSCAVTGSRLLEAVRASHIKPWRASSNKERLDPENGLPLVASLDALFDAGFVSFSDSGKLLMSSALPKSERELHGARDGSLRRKPAGKTGKYLTFHRAKVFRA
ncbi:MAG TPA: HNH endonuclease [Pirellulaceae bacterium]|nr:HNH endonuclease [Pirellulaceae bacterium]